MVINDRAFSFPFRDRQWASKFLIGSLLVLVAFVVPIVPLLFVLGYVVRSMQFTIRTGESRLPEWDGWAELAANGFLAMLIHFIYALPGLLLIIGGGVAYGLHKLVIVAGTDLPSWGVLMPFAAGSGVLLLGAIVAFAGGVLALLIGVLLSPMAMARFAASGDLAAALQVGRVWAITRARLGSFALVWAITLGLSHIAGAVYGLLVYTVCCCWIAPLVSAPLSVYTLIVGMTLFARVYREGESATPGATLLPDKTNSSRAAEAAEEIADDSVAGQPPTSGDEAGTCSEHDAPTRTPADSFNARELNAIGLSGRAQRVLEANGFVTVGQIVRALARGEKELLAIEGFGVKSLEELKARLEASRAALQS